MMAYTKEEASKKLLQYHSIDGSEKREGADGFNREMCIYNTKDFSRFQRVRREHAGTILKILEYRGQIEALSILNDAKSFAAEHGLMGTRDISIGEVREPVGT